MAHTLTFKLTRDQYEARKKTVNESGHPLTGDSGKISQQGISLGVAYDEPSQTLTVTVLSKPFVVPESLVENKISAWFA